MDMTRADQTPSNSALGRQSTFGDPRLSRTAQRPTINTSHPPTAPRQAPTPAETPNSSRALEPVKQAADRVPPNNVSNQSSDSLRSAGNQATVDTSHLIPILLNFTELAAIKGLKEKDKAALQEECASIKRRLEKTKSRDAFPIVIENIQAEEAAAQSKLRKLQQELNDYEKTRQQMAESLRGVLSQTSAPISALIPTAFPDSNPDESVEKKRFAKLEAENREMKVELQRLRELIMQKSPEIPTGMQSQLLKLENSVNTQSMSNQGTNKRIRKLEEWKEGVENGTIKTYPHAPEKELSPPPDLEPLRQDVKAAYGKAADAQKRAEAMGDRISVLQKDILTLRSSLDLYSPSRSEFEKTMKFAEGFMKQVPEIKKKLETLEKDHLALKGAAAIAKTKLHELDTRYMTLNDAHNVKIAHLESKVGQIGPGEKSVSSAEPRQQSEGSGEVKQNIEKLESSHRSLWNNVNKLILDMPKALESSKQVQKYISAIDSLVTAVRSLEIRYSNINSEHLVKNMSAAMTEMFPSTPQILEQVSQLRAYCTKEIAALKTATPNTDLAPMEAKLNQFREEISGKLLHIQTSLQDQARSLNEQLEETWELKNKFQTQSDAFSELGESIPHALQQVESVSELSQRLEALYQDIETLRACLESQDVKETVTELSQKLEILSGNIDLLCTKQYAQETMHNVTEISEKLTDLTANYQSLEARVGAREQTGWQEVEGLKADHRNLLEELKAAKTGLESPDRSERMTELFGQLQTLSADFKYLQAKCDEEFKSIQARVDSLGHSEEMSSLRNELLSQIEKVRTAIQSGLRRNAATGETNRLNPFQMGASNAPGDHFSILGSAARNQIERGNLPNRPSISHAPIDKLAPTSGTSGLQSESDPLADDQSPISAHSSDAEVEPRLRVKPLNAAADQPIDLRITENENGPHEPRQVSDRPLRGSNTALPSSSRPPTAEIPIAQRITGNESGSSENGPSRKRPRRESFSDDEPRPWPTALSRVPNEAGSSTNFESAQARKARKKQEKRERKELKKKLKIAPR